MRILSTVKLCSGQAAEEVSLKRAANFNQDSQANSSGGGVREGCRRDSASWLCYHPMREIYLDEAKQLGEKTFRPQHVCRAAAVDPAQLVRHDEVRAGVCTQPLRRSGWSKAYSTILPVQACSSL